MNCFSHASDEMSVVVGFNEYLLRVLCMLLLRWLLLNLRDFVLSIISELTHISIMSLNKMRCLSEESQQSQVGKKREDRVSTNG